MMNILLIFIVYLVVWNLVKYFKVDDMLVGMMGIVCFMILYLLLIIKDGVIYLLMIYLGV